MKKKILSALLASILVTGTATASSEIENYKPSTQNQVGRNVDHNSGDTYVDPDRFKSLSLAEAQLRSLERYSDSISSEMGHIIIYGNQLTNINEFLNTKVIHGDLKIHNNPLRHIRGAQNVVRIGGNVHINNTQLEEGVDGFLMVEIIGGDVLIDPSAFKDRKVNARGFRSLRIVDGEFRLKNIRIEEPEHFALEVVNGVLNLENTGLEDISWMSRLRYANGINLRGNNIIDANPLSNVEVEGYILIDKMVVNNPNFRKMRASARLCQPEMAKHFHPSGATQADVCG